MNTRKKVLATLSFILLASTSLVACQSHQTALPITEKSSTRSTRHSKMVKRSSPLKTTASTSQYNPEAKEASSTSETAKTSVATSGKSTTTTSGTGATKSSTSKSSSSQSTATSSSATAKSSPTIVSLPAEAVGTWKGSTNQASSVSLTISSDGSFHVVSEFGDNYKVDETLTVGKLELIAPNVYHIVEYSGSVEPLLPGVTGLGGSGSKSTHGFMIQNGKYSPLIWTVPTTEDYDFSQRNTFGVVLTKE